jgi:16S rRNA (cytosine1402-N4)-methyltransferase
MAGRRRKGGREGGTPRPHGEHEDLDQEGDDERGYHEPVLLDEVLDFLAPSGDGVFLDGTLGGGGHARALLERCPGCRLLAVDRDPEALAEAERFLAPHASRARLLRSGFHQALEAHGITGPTLAGALLDLGVSSHQLDADARGFSVRRGVVLDMRLGGEHDGELPTAADLLNQADEATLGRIFREYGEEPRGRALAREVVRRRGNRPFQVSDDLVNALAAVVKRAPWAREKARVFQALRIAVNRELEVLEEALPRLRDALRPGGRLVVIAYHSLEDRLVKHSFREWSRECVCPPALPVCMCRGKALGRTLTIRPVYPSEAEVERNPRARSARLRVWERAA